MKIKITTSAKILCFIFTTIGAISSFAVFNFLFLFLYDLDYFDQYNLPRISKNYFFNFCDIFVCEEKTLLMKKLMFNCALILLFWVHHIVSANQKFKDFLTKISTYPVYERGLYVLSKFYTVYTV
jgi:hypothetical protein